MYETLLFLHVLAAFALGATVVMYVAYTLGAVPSTGAFSLSGWLWDVGGVGTLVLGIWLALDVDGYAVSDGWILAAIVLWAVAFVTGMQARETLRPVVAGSAPGAGAIAIAPDEAATLARRAALWNWARAALTVAILVLMVWKPGG